MRRIAIIPARGGSKRIERKNIKPFCELPIIAYSILAALHSGVFDMVMVSTDDHEIADVARRYGAEVPFMRSAKTSDDYATTADVINEVLDRLAGQGEEFDAFCCIYATAPFVTADKLRTAASLLDNPEVDGAFTCVQYSYPIQRALRIDDRGFISMRSPEYATARSQDLEPTYHDAGQFYFKKVREFRESGSLWGAKTLPIVLSELEVQDLDTLTDWRIAEMKYRLLQWPSDVETDHYRFLNYTALDADMTEAVRVCRNDEEVCRFSLNHNPIDFKSHLQFVESLRVDRSRAYYAVTDLHGKLVGGVNIHILGDGVAERGIWIAPAARRQGHAKCLLQEFYSWLKSERGISSIVTEVFVDNSPSIALERCLGAIQTNHKDNLLFFNLKL